MARKLTKKEKGFIKDYIATGNATKAVLDNYDTKDENVAGSMGSQNLGKLKIQRALEDALPNDLLESVHLDLLKARSLDHTVFATGPRDDLDKERYIETAIAKAKKEKKPYTEEEYVTDEDIMEMLLSVNCLVRRVVHRETARDVYFWAPDNMARDKALDKAYKIKGTYAPEKKDLTTKGEKIEGGADIDALAHMVGEELRKIKTNGSQRDPSGT